MLREPSSRTRVLAGGGRRDSNLTYVRHVPRFLQSHAHLLGKKGEDEPALATKRPREGSDSDVEDEKVRTGLSEVGFGLISQSASLSPVRCAGGAAVRGCGEPLVGPAVS